MSPFSILATCGASSLSVHWRSILRAIFCSSVKSSMVSTSYRHDAVLAPGAFDAFVPRELETERQHGARIARIDHVVDQSPAGDLVDIDMLLNRRRELLLDLGRRLPAGKQLTRGDTDHSVGA